MLIKTFSLKNLVLTALLLLTVFSLAACQPAATATTEADKHEVEQEHTSEAEQMDRIPNDGAIIHLLSPTDGATYKTGEDIVVEVEVENFDLRAEGNHWHLYVDGRVLSMMAGGSTKTVIHGLEAGKHELEVYLGLPSHEELEDGAAVTIMVTE